MHPYTLCNAGDINQNPEKPLQGPQFALEIAGSVCTEHPDSGVVTCMPPTVTLTKTAGGCNLKYTSSEVIQVGGCNGLITK